MNARQSLLSACVVVILASVYVNGVIVRGEKSVPRRPLSFLPKTIDGWEGSDQDISLPVLRNLGVDEYLMRRYANGKEMIWLYIGYYRSQKEGAVPHSPRQCYPGSGFTMLSNRRVEVPTGPAGAAGISVNEYVFGKGGEREVVVYWYQSRGRVVADEYMEKYYLIRDTILRNRSDGALVRVSTNTTEAGVVDASKTLLSFVRRTYRYIPLVVPN